MWCVIAFTFFDKAPDLFIVPPFTECKMFLSLQVFVFARVLLSVFVYFA